MRNITPMYVGLTTMVAALVIASAPVDDVDGFTATTSINSLVLPASQTAPYLSERGWMIDGHLATDPKPELLAWAKRTNISGGGEAGNTFMLVSLGPTPTYGVFLRTARSLKQMGFCHIFIKEGGQDAGALLSEHDIEMPGLDLC